jgi:hypothetical protein
VKRDGAWRFARRSYRYIWLDLKSPIGGDVIGWAGEHLTLELERQKSGNYPKSEAIDYNRLMQANLTRVFNERDARRRIVAIRELYGDYPEAIFQKETEHGIESRDDRQY